MVGALTVLLSAVAAVGLAPPTASALAPVNPVEVPIDGHPANSGFLVFVENDVTIRADESEGTMAMGGDLHVQHNYQVAAGAAPARPTYVAPGDTGATYLHVGGGISWDSPTAVVNVENGGFTKVADTSTYTAYNRDNNNALVNYRLVPNGQPYNVNPHIDGRTNQQSPASIAAPVPTDLIDIPAAFDTYRDLTQEMAGCPATVDLVDDQGTTLPRPIPVGARGRLTLIPGQTNVLTLSSVDLSRLSEITFTNQPSASTPILINVTGTTYLGNIPNLAGVSGSQAPYMLWNFPDATTIVVNGGATIEGTLYAPNANLTWIPSQNIEGNIIAASFNHGLPGRARNLREVHDFPFSTTLSCTAIDPDDTASLTLVKEVDNANGGTAEPGDWTLSANGPTPITGPSATDPVTAAEVAPGDYVLAESDGPDGYDASDWACDGGTLNESTLTLDTGDDVTCTIVNTAQAAPAPPLDAELTLVKDVVNNDGGLGVETDWELSADGPTPISGITGSADVTGVFVEPGDYTLAETGGPADYEASDWDCDGGSLSGDVVTLEPGDVVTCTIVNDDTSTPGGDTARLTLVKEVDNAGGGTADPSDWTLTATGPNTITGITGTSPVTGVEVRPGDYSLTEADGPDGYRPSTWACTDGTLDGSQLTLTSGDEATCTIVNTYQAASPTPTPSPTPSPPQSPTPTATTPTTPASDPTFAEPNATDTIEPRPSQLADTGGPSSTWLLAGITSVLIGGLLLIAAGDQQRPRRKS